MIIAVDGTLASGKGTLAKKLAKHFGLNHLDTGLLYRATAYIAHARGIGSDDTSEIVAIAENLSLDGIKEEALRTQAVGEWASAIAKVPEIRAALLAYQKDFANSPEGAVLDGRDIGTVICPHADYKFWIDAHPETRAKRRLNELLGRGEVHSFEDVLDSLLTRDRNDANRADAPMVKATDAVEINTTHLNADEVLALAIRHIV